MAINLNHSVYGAQFKAFVAFVAIASVALMAAPSLFGEGGCQKCPDENYGSESALPRLEALVFDVDGSRIYGQILVPSANFGGGRPCAIICHGFAGFTRWDDLAHDLCRSGIAVMIPHHRGAWGSEGEYTVSGCIRDAAMLAEWAMGAEFAERYGTDTNAVYLIGHSMGGNSVLNAATRTDGVRGIALVAPCDIGFMAAERTPGAMTDFLVGEGLHVLKRRSDAAVVDDIYANADAMRFTNAAKALSGRKVFLATGDYDNVVPSAPLDEFWKALGGDSAIHVRRRYQATHSMMGRRRQLAKDLIDFILDRSR
jgi:pimeloyl-ACP methyl ester carboxylesterase